MMKIIVESCCIQLFFYLLLTAIFIGHINNLINTSQIIFKRDKNMVNNIVPVHSLRFMTSSILVNIHHRV